MKPIPSELEKAISEMPADLQRLAMAAMAEEIDRWERGDLTPDERAVIDLAKSLGRRSSEYIEKIVLIELEKGGIMEKNVLGSKMRDTVSGFEGVAIGKTQWLNGCVRIALQPRVDKDGKLPESQWFDEPQLEVIEDAKPKKKDDDPPGGPRMDPGRAADPVR